VAIRLTKGIGKEIKERKGERKREVKEISNVISRTLALSQGHGHNYDVSCQPMQQNAEIKQNSLRPVNSTPPQIITVCSQYSQLCEFACESTKTSTPTYVSNYLFGITRILILSLRCMYHENCINAV
jgi:hypothetical protein